MLLVRWLADSAKLILYTPVQLYACARIAGKAWLERMNPKKECAECRLVIYHIPIKDILSFNVAYRSFFQPVLLGLFRIKDVGVADYLAAHSISIVIFCACWTSCMSYRTCLGCPL